MGRATALLAVVLTIALAGCGSAATGAPSVAPSASSSPIPQASFSGGPAGARLATPTETGWDGGWCERGPGDAWLAVNIGSPNGDEYFGLVVGRSPYLPAATRAAAGGGSFGGADASITWRRGGDRSTMVAGGLAVEVAKDLSLGTFTGRLADGTAVQGSFSCAS